MNSGKLITFVIWATIALVIYELARTLFPSTASASPNNPLGVPIIAGPTGAGINATGIGLVNSLAAGIGQLQVANAAGLLPGGLAKGGYGDFSAPSVYDGSPVDNLTPTSWSY